MSASTAARTPDPTVSLTSLLRHAVVDADDRPLGRVEDVVVRLRDNHPALVTGLVVSTGNSRVFIPVGDVASIDVAGARTRTGSVDMRPFQRREGEVLLRQDVLGHRLIDVARSALVKANDIHLAKTAEGWAAVSLDVNRSRWFHFGAQESQPARDWRGFLLLTGNEKALRSLPLASRLRRLKPAQIADIIEGASAQEQDELLAQVHTDPELEADVFEELDEDRQAQLLKSRGDRDVADVLSRMRADDAADAIMELPQDRRRKVLALLPQPQSGKVLALLGYHDATAGGLMGTDFLALPEDHTIADALQKLRAAVSQQPEALTTIHSLRADGTLAGTLGLVRALQMDASTLLLDAAEPNAVVASPEDDIISVTTRMADYNLLSLPVVDAGGRILGIVTVDDALEAAIPRDWSQRKAGRA